MNSGRVLKSMAIFLGVVLLLSGQTRTCIADDGEPIRLRVMTYNIHHGEGTDGRFDLARIAAIIRAAKPDLVALQEVERNTSRTGQIDQPAELGRLTGLQSEFGGNIPYAGGEYGNAVLSRLPIKHRENELLPALGSGEQRGLLEVEVELPDGQPLHFLATHLDHRPSDRERIASAQEINRRSQDYAGLAILAGDLNDLPDSEALSIFKQAWSLPGSGPYLTSPASKPRRQIDYVLVRPAQRWKLLDMRVLDEPIASDHRPLLATFELVPAD